MDERVLFETVKFVRSGTLALLNNLTEQEVDTIPAGFRNNIRWHLGHIYVTQENMVLGTARIHRELPDGFSGWFDRGTSPADWNGQPPTLPELKDALEKQSPRLAETLSGKLGLELAQPFQLPGMKLTTVGEMVHFSLVHEGQHTGIIKGLKYALSV